MNAACQLLNVCYDRISVQPCRTKDVHKTPL